MFERSLSALIKGLRSHRGKDEPKYVSQLMDEIRHEVRSGDMQVKAEAVLKLTYLQMLGYPFSGASFHMLEIMASPRYHLKHVGYLAVAQCFSQDTDVLILATNIIKKDLQSSNPLDVAMALNGLSHIVTPDLARHLGPDTIALLTHSRPMIRKKAILVLYSIIIKSPDILDAAWHRLGEKLQDTDLPVVSAAVNIICELARRDARPFLPLSPQLFHLLTTSTNNWMLIKVIKLFASLTPLEPRLVRKLIPPITTIISTTPAMSLLYECIHTVIIGGMLHGQDGDSLAKTCVEKLARFLEDADQNLKYISLLALVKILPTHPHLVAEHQEIIFESIEDPDLSIRLRALELVSGMASSRNLKPIVTQLLSHLEPPFASAVKTTSAAAAALKAATALNSNPTLSPTYRLEIVRRILSLGNAETYANVHDFQWYFDVLVRLALIANVQGQGGRIRDQMIDITVRVRALRPFAVRALIPLLEDGRVDPIILEAVAWVCGEYADSVPNPPGTILSLLKHPSPSAVHNAIQLYAFYASGLSSSWDASQYQPILDLSRSISTRLEGIRSEETETIERTSQFTQLFHLLLKDLEGNQAKQEAPKSLNLLSPLFFTYALGPVADKAQGKVPVPEGLELDAWIVEPHTVAVEELEMPLVDYDLYHYHTTAETAPAPVHSKKKNADHPFYLPSSSGKKKKKAKPVEEDQVDAIPIVQLDLSDLPVLESKETSHPKLSKKKKRKSTPAEIVLN